MSTPNQRSKVVKNRKQSVKRKRKTLKRKLTLTKPVLAKFPHITQADMDVLNNDNSLDEIGPPLSLSRAESVFLEEVKVKDEECPTPPPTPTSKKHCAKNCRRVFVPLTKGDMADMVDDDGYYLVSIRDQKTSMLFRRVVKTARMHTSLYLPDNKFKMKDLSRRKSELQMNGRNASRAPGMAEIRGLSIIESCFLAGIPLSVSLLKDFGFGADKATFILKKWKDSKDDVPTIPMSE